MKLIFNQVSVLDSQFVASSGFASQTYAALVGIVNGITGAEIGPVPGFLVQSSSGDNAVELADGPSLAGVRLGIVASATINPNIPQSNTEYQFNEASAQALSVAYGPTRGEFEAYAIRNEANSADLSYAAGDKLYRSTYGCITKDSATSSEVIGFVTAITPDGALSAVLL